MAIKKPRVKKPKTTTKVVDPSKPKKRYPRKKLVEPVITGLAQAQESKGKRKSYHVTAADEDRIERARLAALGWRAGKPPFNEGVAQASFYGHEGSKRHWDGKLWSIPWFTEIPPVEPRLMPRVELKTNESIMWRM